MRSAKKYQLPCKKLHILGNIEAKSDQAEDKLLSAIVIKLNILSPPKRIYEIQLILVLRRYTDRRTQAKYIRNIQTFQDSAVFLRLILLNNLLS